MESTNVDSIFYFYLKFKTLHFIKIKERHTAKYLDAPLRFQEYGVGIFTIIQTKSALKKAIKKGEIHINGKRATTSVYIYGGEQICFFRQESPKPSKQLILPLNVIFEDEYLAVIHKPPGILVSGNSFKTIAKALTQNLKPSSIIDATIPQPVHRLDYGTTGVLLIGKTQDSIRTLNKMFENKEITKTYLAVSMGHMKTNSGIFNTNIDDKISKTLFKIQQTVKSPKFEELNLVELNPKTGRRHQIRKHLAQNGTPILGDLDYGMEGMIVKGKGLYLHAHSLRLNHPYTQQEMCFESPLPLKFLKIFKRENREET